MRSRTCTRQPRAKHGTSTSSSHRSSTTSAGSSAPRIAFEDVTRFRLLQSELHASKQELDTAYEELQSTNEELETTNEELQSTVEELETTNEELQSTNEELETMNEELQSTNEELQTMNDELRSRTTDLDTINTFLESVFSSLRPAVAVLDPDFTVKVWNLGARELWGVTTEEAVGVNFLALDIGLPVAELRQPIREVLSGTVPEADATLQATSRRGRSIQCWVRLTAAALGGTHANHRRDRGHGGGDRTGLKDDPRAARGLQFAPLRRQLVVDRLRYNFRHFVKCHPVCQQIPQHRGVLIGSECPLFERLRHPGVIPAPRPLRQPVRECGPFFE